jgi:hypothetical protein
MNSIKRKRQRSFSPRPGSTNNSTEILGESGNPETSPLVWVESVSREFVNSKLMHYENAVDGLLEVLQGVPALWCISYWRISIWGDTATSTVAIWRLLLSHVNISEQVERWRESQCVYLRKKIFARFKSKLSISLTGQMQLKTFTNFGSASISSIENPLHTYP